MKKILAFMLVMSMLCTGIAFADEYSDVTEKIEAIDVVTGLGIMDAVGEDAFSPDVNITRGELAKIISKIYNSQDPAAEQWKKIYYRSVEEERSLKEPPENVFTRYTDVEKSSEYYDYVMSVSDIGIMIGVGENVFDVEGYATISQLATVLVRMSGYELYIERGSQNEYIAVAQSMKLFKNIEKDFSEQATRADTAQMIFNCFDVPLIQYAIDDGFFKYVKEDDQTFLSELLGITKFFDRMTDNGFSTFYSESMVGSNNCIIGNYTFEIPQKLEKIRNYIGREVQVFCREDNGDYELVYVRLSGRDSIKTFDIKDFTNYSVTKIGYEEGAKEKSISIEANAGMILNGLGTNYYDASTFDFLKGTVSVITPKGGNKGDLLVIKEYHDFVIDSIDSDNRIIYSKNTLLNEEKMIDISDDDRMITIYNDDGTESEFQSLTVGNVASVCVSSKVCEIYLSSKKITGCTVKGIESHENYTYIKSENGTFKLSKEFELTQPQEIPKLGKKYNLSLDIFDEVVSVSIESSNEGIAMLIKTRLIEDDDSGEEYINISYFSSDESINKKKLAKRVKVTNFDNTQTTWKFPNSAQDAYELLHDYHSLFIFKLNDDGEVCEIELPSKQHGDGNAEGRLVEIKTNKSNDYYPGYGFYYKINVGFSGQIVTNSSTKVFCIDTENPTDEDSYSLANMNLFVNDNKYEIKGYTTVKDSALAQYIVYEHSYKKTLNKGDNLFAVVMDVYEGLDADEAPADIITLALNSNNCQAQDYIVSEGVYEEVKNLQGDSTYIHENGNAEKLKVEKGDIVKYAINNKGEVSELILVYDANAINPDSGGIGNFPNTIGYWNSENFTYSNPFGVDESSYKFNPNAYMWSTSGGGIIRFMRVSPVSVVNDCLKVTTQDLNVFSYDSENPKYITEIEKATNGWFISKDRKGKITVEKKNFSDSLKTYDIVGKKCDRIVISMRVGAVRSIFIYAGDWE